MQFGISLLSNSFLPSSIAIHSR